MAPKIITSGSSWVEPAGPIIPRIITCSATENQCAQVYPTGYFCFKNNKDTREPMVQYEILKKSLARVLYEQNALAGTLQQDDRGAYSIELPAAPRAGIRFHYRDLRNDSSFPTFDELAAGHFPIIDIRHDGLGLLGPEDFPGSQAGDPTSLAQYIILRGGSIVTLSWTHQMGDLLQPRMSALSWAAQTKLLCEAQDAGMPEPALPTPMAANLSDRTRLLPEAKDMSFEEVQAACDRRGDMFVFDPTNPEQTAALMSNVFPPAYLKDEELAHEDHLRTETAGMMLMSLKQLQRLQALVQAGATQKLSIVNIIIALFWQRFYVAKYGLQGQSSAELEAKAKSMSTPAIIFPGDIRGRLNPPLPPNFIGAAVDLFKASVEKPLDFIPTSNSTAELSKTLGTAASAVRNSANGWKEDVFMELLTLFSSTPVSVPFMPKGPLEFLVTDHSRNAPMLADSWGTGLGVPTSYRQPYIGRDIPQGEVTLLGRHANGDIEIMVTAERITMQRMWRDPVLLEFAKPLFTTYNVPQAVAAKRAAEYTPNARL